MINVTASAYVACAYAFVANENQAYLSLLLLNTNNIVTKWPITLFEENKFNVV